MPGERTADRLSLDLREERASIRDPFAPGRVAVDRLRIRYFMRTIFLVVATSPAVRR